jgi:hypothetical protein
MYRLVLGAALLAAVMAPGYAQDAATIQKLNEGFVETLKKGDFAALAGMYTEDAHCFRLEPTRSRGAVPFRHSGPRPAKVSPTSS